PFGRQRRRARASSLHHLEPRLSQLSRAGSHRHREEAWFYHWSKVGAGKRQIGRVQGKRHCMRFAGCECDALEPSELEHWPSEARDLVVDIELNHLVARALAGIRHPYTDAEGIGAVDP